MSQNSPQPPEETGGVGYGAAGASAYDATIQVGPPEPEKKRPGRKVTPLTEAARAIGAIDRKIEAVAARRQAVQLRIDRLNVELDALIVEREKARQVLTDAVG